MRKYFLLLLFCSNALLAIAQEPTLADKLKKELAARPAHDTVRLNKLIEMGTTGVFTLAERDTYLTEAVSLSRKLGHEFGEAYALSNLWFYKLQGGDSAASESFFRKADALVKKMGIDGLKGLMLFRLAQKKCFLEYRNRYAG